MRVFKIQTITTVIGNRLVVILNNSLEQYTSMQFETQPCFVDWDAGTRGRKTDNCLLELLVVGKNPHRSFFPVASVAGAAENGLLSLYSTRADSSGENFHWQILLLFKVFFDKFLDVSIFVCYLQCFFLVQLERISHQL